jgi:hypothetical protein
MSWSSVRADKLTNMGKRPTNSGIRPYAVRSALSTDSSKDEVIAPLVTPLVAMLARTGAPKPIDESCRLAEH